MASLHNRILVVGLGGSGSSDPHYKFNLSQVDMGSDQRMVPLPADGDKFGGRSRWCAICLGIAFSHGAG